MPLQSNQIQYMVREMIKFSPDPVLEGKLESFSGTGFLGTGEKLEVVWALPEGVVFLDGPGRTIGLSMCSRVMVSGDGPKLSVLGELRQRQRQRGLVLG